MDESLDRTEKALGADRVRDLKEQLLPATQIVATAMDRWDEPLGAKEWKQILDFVQLFTATTGNDNVVLFQFPPALAELFHQLVEEDANVPQRLAKLLMQPPVERALEISPEGYLYFLDGLKYGVETEANAAKMEAAMLKAADTPSLIANIRREALYCAAMSAGAQYLLAEKRKAPEARAHLDRAVGYARQRLELGSVRSVHASYLFRVARRGRAYDIARVVIDDRLRATPGDQDWLANRAQIDVLAGSFQPALAAADQVLAKRPGDWDVRRYRAEAVLGLKEVLSGNEPLDAGTLRGALGRPPEDATDEADKLVAGKPSASDFYNAAHAHALAAAAAPPGPKREGHESRALELLGKASAGGYFGSPTNVDMFQVERGFRILRSRPEVQKLLPPQDHNR
jgi:hypothetical protein